MRSETPAAFQYGFAIFVHFSSSSHATSWPRGGSTSAIPSAVKPVNTPISNTRSAFTSRTSICNRPTVSGGLMLRATGPSAHVAACNADSSGELRTPTLTRYSCSSGCRPMLFDCGAALWRRLSKFAALAASVHGTVDTRRTASALELRHCPRGTEKNFPLVELAAQHTVPAWVCRVPQRIMSRVARNMSSLRRHQHSVSRRSFPGTPGCRHHRSRADRKTAFVLSWTCRCRRHRAPRLRLQLAWLRHNDGPRRGPSQVSGCIFSPLHRV